MHSGKDITKEKGEHRFGHYENGHLFSQTYCSKSHLTQMIYVSQPLEECFSPENVKSVENEIQFVNMLRTIKLTV